MAINVLITSRAEFKGNDGITHVIGNKVQDSPLVLTTSGNEIHDQTHSVTTGSIQKIFDVDEDLGDFEFLAIEASGDGLLELVTDDDADNGEAYFVQEIKANFPYMLGSDTSLASDGAVALFTGTSDVIETIRFKNTGTATVTVRCVVVT